MASVGEILRNKLPTPDTTFTAQASDTKTPAERVSAAASTTTPASATGLQSVVDKPVKPQRKTLIRELSAQTQVFLISQGFKSEDDINAIIERSTGHKTFPFLSIFMDRPNWHSSRDPILSLETIEKMLNELMDCPGFDTETCSLAPAAGTRRFPFVGKTPLALILSTIMNHVPGGTQEKEQDFRD